MSVWCRSGVAAAALLVLAAGDVAGRAWAGGYGTITGQFVIDGPLPALSPVVKQGDNSVRDAAVCAKENVPNESLVVDPATKGIANVFVFMPTAPEDIAPELKESREKVVKFDQKGCRFIPHALVLRTDQTIAILSDDPIAHNTNVNTTENMGQNSLIQPGDRSGAIRWNFPVREKYVTMVQCNIHGWMQAWWLIIDHPYATITDKEGHFTISKVPAGDHNFTAWHERGGWMFGRVRAKRSRSISIKAGQTTNIGVIPIKADMFRKE